MNSRVATKLRLILALASAATLVSCGSKGGATIEAAPAAASPAAPQAPAAPPAGSTGGFDGQRAYQYVSDLVAIGPRTAGTDGNHHAQQYIIGKLQSFGCPVDQEDFSTPTPTGTVAMHHGAPTEHISPRQAGCERPSQCQAATVG